MSSTCRRYDEFGSGSLVLALPEIDVGGGAVDRNPVAFFDEICLAADVHGELLLVLVDRDGAPAPTMQGRPMPRATTAAWLDLPPTAVRMPFATSMP